MLDVALRTVRSTLSRPTIRSLRFGIRGSTPRPGIPSIASRNRNGFSVAKFDLHHQRWDLPSPCIAGVYEIVRTAKVCNIAKFACVSDAKRIDALAPTCYLQTYYHAERIRTRVAKFVRPWKERLEESRCDIRIGREPSCQRACACNLARLS